jgi:hypothetical protein
MNNTQTLNRNFEAIAWGALFIWWGITEMMNGLPNGTGLIGIGLILLGVNALRAMNGIRINGFSTTIGVLALAWGVLELAGAVLSLPFELPVFAILLMVLGAIILAPALFKSENQ